MTGLPVPRSGRGSPSSRPPPARARWPRSAAPRAGRLAAAPRTRPPGRPDPPVQARRETCTGGGTARRAPSRRCRGPAAALPAGQPRLDRRGDQPVAEQRDVLGPRPGRRLLIIDEADLAPPRRLAGPAGRRGQPGWRPACGYVTGELASIAPGGQAGESRPPATAGQPAATATGLRSAATAPAAAGAARPARRAPRPPGRPHHREAADHRRAHPAGPAATPGPDQHAGRTGAASRGPSQRHPGLRGDCVHGIPPRRAAAPSRPPPPSTAALQHRVRQQHPRRAARLAYACRGRTRPATPPARISGRSTPTTRSETPPHRKPGTAADRHRAGLPPLASHGSPWHRRLQAPRTALPVATATETGGPFPYLDMPDPVAGHQHPTSPSRHPRPQRRVTGAMR